MSRDSIGDDLKGLRIDEVQKDCELGFVESPRFDWSTLRQLFPEGLAGGVPAWLDPVNLPSGGSILCDLCEEPLQFLLQLYAPRSDKESTFHRTLFVFMCRSMSCLLRDQHEQRKRAPEKAMRSIKVFRCQLPCVNPFYSSEDPKDDGTDKPLGYGAPLCTWCGTWKGDQLCIGCKNVQYCSPKHQALHWRSDHQTECQKLATVINNEASLTQKPQVASKSPWKEFVMFTRPESKSEDDDDDDDLANEALVSTREVDEDLESLMKDFEGDADKKNWTNFLLRIDKASAQVLRFCPGAKPLWPLTTGRIAETEIPNCKSCGGSLRFEFQVMPQLLFFLGGKNDRDSLDWATIVVYTCENSCESSLSYKEEFVWVQIDRQTI